MKVRNKKTGEICELVGFNISNDSFKEKFGKKDYYSLQEFCEEWEDYNPKEPLIKDMKIRKAVRAWADANGIDESSYHEIKVDHSEHRLKWIRTIIEFDSIEGLENLVDGREYTIAELCGEEEE